MKVKEIINKMWRVKNPTVVINERGNTLASLELRPFDEIPTEVSAHLNRTVESMIVGNNKLLIYVK